MDDELEGGGTEMARRSTGGVVVDTRRKSPVFALRSGRRRTALRDARHRRGGLDASEGRVELQNVLADVRRGIWRPPDREAGPHRRRRPDPTFHEFASQWFDGQRGRVAESTRAGLHMAVVESPAAVLPGHRLSQITIAEVDRYRAAKVREGVLSATSINKTITRLAQILEVAVEYELIDAQPRKGQAPPREGVKARAGVARSGRADRALLDAAGELDRDAPRETGGTSRGARSSRRWCSLGCGSGSCSTSAGATSTSPRGRITVRASKTDAGVRHDRPAAGPARRAAGLQGAAPDASRTICVFATTTGASRRTRATSATGCSRRGQRANERLTEAGEVPLPERLTPHKLRHTFASLLVALGVDPGSVMDQLGHTDPTFTLRVYRHGMRRDQASKDALRALVGGADWAAPGSNGAGSSRTTGVSLGAGLEKIPRCWDFQGWARLGSNQRPLACEARDHMAFTLLIGTICI